MPTGLLYARIRGILVTRSPFSRWSITFISTLGIVGAWFFWLYLPLTAEINQLLVVTAQRAPTEKLIIQYREELCTLNHTIETATATQSSEKKSTGPVFLQQITVYSHDHNLELQECTIDRLKGSEKQNHCTWSVEGRYDKILTYLNTLFATTNVITELKKLSLNFMSPERVHAQGTMILVCTGTK